MQTKKKVSKQCRQHKWSKALELKLRLRKTLLQRTHRPMYVEDKLRRMWQEAVQV